MLYCKATGKQLNNLIKEKVNPKSRNYEVRLDFVNISRI